MTGEHDYDTTVQPFVCRRCELTLDEARTMADPRQCWPIVYENGTYRPRHAADDYGAIAERLKELGYRGWATG